MKRSAAILNALADLSPSAEQTASSLVVPLDWFEWIGVGAWTLFDPMSRDSVDTIAAVMGMDPSAAVGSPVDRRLAERLAAVDQIRPTQHSLRVGWLFLAGRHQGRRVFHPLISTVVRVRRTSVDNRLIAAGDAELTPLIADPAARRGLEGRMEFGRGGLGGISGYEIPRGLLRRFLALNKFAMEAAAAAGFEVAEVVPADASPDAYLRRDGVVVVAGFGVYADHDTTGASRAGSLRDWAGAVESNDAWTAFHSVYLDRPSDAPEVVPDDGPVESPFLLTPAQADAVRRSRTAPITVVSGPPGSGKSHTVVAVACDALARGERVLVAVKTDAAVDALLDLFERAPTVDPVVFGSNERKDALAARLSGGQVQPRTEMEVLGLREAMDRAVRQRNRLRHRLEERLQAEALYQRDGSEVADVRDRFPGLFEPGVDLDQLEEQLEGHQGGWLARRRARRAARAVGARDAAVEEVQEGIDLARAAQMAYELPRRGGLTLDAEWDELLAAEDAARLAVAQWLEADSRSTRRLNRMTLPTIAAVATALRSGRAARRDQLRRLNDERLTLALPLWLGTLPDIDDLLPALAGLFDLVVLDEASSIDQPLAAPALLRAKRATVVGDPHQLRHVSFLSDERTMQALRDNRLDHDPVLCSRLNVRRNSALDVAAGVAPVVMLNEQFRSYPHLVEFVTARLYKGDVSVASRSPRTHSIDCIDMVRVDGKRTRAGVVEAEVERVVKEVRRLSQRGSRSVGVVTPFRSQAEALEKALLKEFTADELERLDLRVGTVHAQQGNERDVMVASVGIGPEDVSSWRFLEDPHVFAVFATRARDHLMIILSADPPVGGLMEEYLAQADGPPGPPRAVAAVDAWAAAVAEDLRTAGAAVSTAYPAGRHVVDVCTDDGHTAVSVECVVHPDGPAAHVDRHLSLRRLGWEVFDAYKSRWDGRRGELAVELARRLRVEPPPG